jgi:hypothetical protein
VRKPYAYDGKDGLWICYGSKDWASSCIWLVFAYEDLVWPTERDADLHDIWEKETEDHLRRVSARAWKDGGFSDADRAAIDTYRAARGRS